MQVYDMQMGNKIGVENHRKAGNARHKTKNKGPTACMGVKACVGGNKMQQATSEINRRFKTVLKTVKCWTLD